MKRLHFRLLSSFIRVPLATPNPLPLLTLPVNCNCLPLLQSHPLLKLWSSSVHWMCTSSWFSPWFSPWSAFPHVMVKSFISLRACRRESMVSAVIWTITPSKGQNKRDAG